MKNHNIVDYRRLYGLAAVRIFTLEQIQAEAMTSAALSTKPSDSWSMQSIQAKAVKEFPLWDKEYVYSEVEKVILKYRGGIYD